MTAHHLNEGADTRWVKAYSTRVCVALVALAIIASGCERRGSNRDSAYPSIDAPAVAPGPVASGVATRTLTVDRGERGQVPVTVWYPTGAAAPAPIVLFSHGLGGLPDDYRSLLSAWAGAGFVVAAPSYPKSKRNSAKIDPLDVGNQPGDATAVLDALLAAGAAPGDALAGRLDPKNIIAAGHSLGAITTVGLFDGCCRDSRLTGGVVLAGNSLGFSGKPSGRAVPVLFVHGSHDALVPHRMGKNTYDRFKWPKAFITLAGERHIDPYLTPTSAAYAKVVADTTAFLRYATGQSSLSQLRATWREATGTATEIDDRLGA